MGAGFNCTIRTKGIKKVLVEKTVWNQWRVKVNKAETIRTYLNDPNRRALISVTALEKRAGLPTGTLNKFLRSERDFPEHHLEKVIRQLEYIGFNIG